MAFSSGQAEIGDQPTLICPVGRGRTIQVKNMTTVTVYLGGPDVTTDGYPLDGGEAQALTAGAERESVVVPAPEGDVAAPELYGLTGDDADGPDAEAARVAWIAG